MSATATDNHVISAADSIAEIAEEALQSSVALTDDQARKLFKIWQLSKLISDPEGDY